MHALKRMERLQYVKSMKSLIGIDIGSRMHFVKAVSGDRILPPFPIANDREGFELILSYIHKTLRTDPKQTLVAFEPTGPYWEPLSQFLESHHIPWVFVSAINTHRIKDLNDNSPNKTDMKDCGVILELLHQGHFLKHPDRSGIYRDLFNLIKFRHQLANQKRVFVNQLYHLLAVYFPELLTVYHDMNVKSIGRILEQYQTPEDVVNAGYQGIYEATKKGRRNPAITRKIEGLLEAARKSIGVRDGVESYRIQVRRLVAQIMDVERQMADLEQRVSVLLAGIPEVAPLKSIKGIGEYSLGVILGYFGRLTNYKNAYEMLKFAGLNLFESSSGLRKGQKHVSKRGPGQLRQVLFMMALRAIIMNPSIRKKYNRMVKHKKSKIKAVVAIMCHMVKLIFAMVRDQKEFDPRMPKKITAA